MKYEKTQLFLITSQTPPPSPFLQQMENQIGAQHFLIWTKINLFDIIIIFAKKKFPKAVIIIF